MSDYVHLHNHTHYSLLDAACTPDQLIRAAVEDGQSAIALTDHGVMFGCYEFYKKAKKAGIKPIIGCEVYLATGSRFDRIATRKGSGQRNYHHLVLLAKNNQGYKNLIKLVSLGHTEGFYYKPRIDRELLVQYKEGLIAVSACLAGVVNEPLVRGDYDTAKKNALWFKEQFGDDWYLELQDHGLPEDAAVLEGIPRIAEECGIKMIVSNDCHYIRKEHAVPHNVHLLIKDVSATTAGTFDVRDLRYKVPEMYFKTQAEMKELFKLHPSAVENTLEIAEKCDVELKTDLKMPIFPIPPTSSAKDLDEYLEELTMLGLERLYKPLTQGVRDRALFELGVIKRMGYAGYFLIVQDFIAAARERGVSVGPGRGSAAGSLVAYALGITKIDPLKFDLFFERFLNPDRVSMPDIDVDFNDEKRNVVIDYVRQKYGNDSVAQIVTFGTLAPRAVIKDVGRVLGVPLSVVNSITEKIPVVQGKVTPIADALQLPDLRWVRDTNDPKIKEMIEIATVLEGFARNASTHAAGVVITPGPVTDYVPIYKPAGAESAESTMYTMKDLEDAGLLKMDFLGLATLSIIDRTIEQVKENYGTEIDIDAIDFDDADVYNMIAQGRTMAVFQFESDKMTEYLRLLAPKNLEELTAMNALYRPGPMDSIPEFIARKHGKKPISYIHPLMETRLKNTYGVIAYQEQVMQLVQDLAGFTLAEADMMRRAMGKKDAAAMAAQRSVFVKGSREHQNIDEKISEQIFDLFQKFSQYGFNKSHSAAYSYLAYQTAWLKHHYTAEFIAANMTNDLSDLARISALRDEAEKFEIRLLSPDVNKSGVTFRAIDPKTILFGMAGIKMVGRPMVEGILRARESGPFTSLYDFVSRVDQNVLNKRALEALIAAGAFDSMNCGHRAQLFAAVDLALDWSRKMSSQQSVHMDSLFGDTGSVMVVEPKLPDVDRWSEKERLEKEYEVLNFYISGHPLQRFIVQLNSFASHQLGKTETITSGKNVRVGGLISSVRLRFDKKEKQIAFALIEDMTGKAEVILWSEAYAQFKELIYEGSAVLVSGKAEVRDDGQLKITADDITPLELVLRKYTRGCKLRINEETDMEKLRQLQLMCVPGSTKGIPVYFHVVRNGEQVASYHAPEVMLPVDDATVKQLTELFGASNIRLMMST